MGRVGSFLAGNADVAPASLRFGARLRPWSVWPSMHVKPGPAANAWRLLGWGSTPREEETQGCLPLLLTNSHNKSSRERKHCSAAFSRQGLRAWITALQSETSSEDSTLDLMEKSEQDKEDKNKRMRQALPPPPPPPPPPPSRPRPFPPPPLTPPLKAHAHAHAQVRPPLNPFALMNDLLCLLTLLITVSIDSNCATLLHSFCCSEETLLDSGEAERGVGVLGMMSVLSLHHPLVLLQHILLLWENRLPPTFLVSEWLPF
eukprot:387296-Rhodomonas_salina.1